MLFQLACLVVQLKLAAPLVDSPQGARTQTQQAFPDWGMMPIYC